MWGFFSWKIKDKRPPHIKNWGSQIFMLGTPLILYVGILYVLFSPPTNGCSHFGGRDRRRSARKQFPKCKRCSFLPSVHQVMRLLCDCDCDILTQGREWKRLYCSGQVRPQGTEICNFGAPSPLEALHWIFCFFSSIYVQFSKTSPLKSGESGEKSSGENRVKSCRVCGCHGFFGPELSPPTKVSHPQSFAILECDGRSLAMAILFAISRGKQHPHLSGHYSRDWSESVNVLGVIG